MVFFSSHTLQKREIVPDLFSGSDQQFFSRVTVNLKRDTRLMLCNPDFHDSLVVFIHVHVYCVRPRC